MSRQDELDLLHELEARAATARFQLYQDPGSVIRLATCRHGIRMEAYWMIVADLRQKVRASARQHWQIIQAAAAWDETPELASRWIKAQCGLLRLALAGILRECHIVDVVDIDASLRQIDEI